MDIIDVMLARAMTPQGQTETYVAKANRAAAKAAQAEQDAAAAIALVTSASETIATAQENAADLLEAAQDALETAQSAQINLPESYSTTGQNTDGYMTQKATTDALNDKVSVNVFNISLASKADAATAATKDYVDQKVAQGGGSGSGTNIHFETDDAGHLLVIGPDGSIIASGATEEAVIEALVRAGTYEAIHAVGLDIDYASRSFTRTQGALNKNMGNDFNEYTMYGGRTRCTVGDDGYINSFYGDQNYTEDGTNGQVMIYQPKFYYKRIIREAESVSKGKVVRHETLLLSDTEQVGFKLAPVFNDGLDYVLLPAFDAGLVNDKLTSISGVRPINNITIEQAEAYAQARGNGWHIMNMEAESANQMLEMVEFGTMNGQNAIELGISYSPSGSNTCYFVTGSTGNGTGHANSTEVIVNGNSSTMTDNGYRAISYRGMENPWGNLWSMIGNFKVVGDGYSGGGTPHINVNGTYVDIGFNLPSTYGWINAMGYGKEEYDWIYMPVECSNSANSLMPVGDGLWTVGALNGTMIVATGGSYGYKEECGPFYYAADRAPNASARYNYGAKLLYIPTKNSAYNANIAKWNTYMGG